MEFELYRPSLENKNIIDKYLACNEYRGCEMSAANNILWAEHYDTYFTVIHDMLVYCHLKDGVVNMTSFPVGDGDKKKVFDTICEYFEDKKLPFCMYLVNEHMFEQIEKWYPGKYIIEYDRDDADYLYSRESLATLSGKKLHGKRNHINRFEELYPDYIYERISSNNIGDCLELANAWAMENADDDSAKHENEAIVFALNNLDKLGLIGALIRVKGKVVAFTLGEQLTKDTFVIHFEKAYADIQGAFAIINRDFVRNELESYTYVNREEDLGLEGLRKAKLSYRPVQLIDKGMVRLSKA